MYYSASPQLNNLFFSIFCPFYIKYSQVWWYFSLRWPAITIKTTITCCIMFIQFIIFCIILCKLSSKEFCNVSIRCGRSYNIIAQGGKWNNVISKYGRRRSECYMDLGHVSGMRHFGLLPFDLGYIGPSSTFYEPTMSSHK